MIPKALHISITNKCTANCDFCSFREFNKKNYPRHIYLPLILGSIFENDLKDIIYNEENEFLNNLIKISPIVMYVKYLKKMGKTLKDVESWDPCFCCYKMRSDKKFIRSFKFNRHIKRNKIVGIKKWKEIIDDSKKIGIKTIIFDGEGEPFLEFKKLQELISCAKEKFRDIIVYTNASFVDNKKNVEKKMKLLKSAGLTCLFISCDENSQYKFHQFFIPEKKILILSNVTKKLHIPTNFACNMLVGADPKGISAKLQKITGRKLKLKFLNQSLLNEMSYWPQKINFSFPLFFSRRRGNLIDLDYVRLNPKVEKRIDSKDIWRYRLPKNILRFYLFQKKLFSHFSKTCSDSIFISNDGTVFRCYTASV